MTPNILLENLKEYIEDVTKDMLLQVRVKAEEENKERPPYVYLMNLPKKEDEIQQIPYILLKYLTSKDDQPTGSPTQSEARIRIIIATYSEDAQEGAMALLNVISRIRYRLLRDREVGGQFSLILPTESIVYQDSPTPYYLGEIMTIWTLPSVEREVKLL